MLTSLSGQTIEVLNTDAEGRLVLADALTYTQRRFKPRAVIDLATLTGAIVQTLGYEHAGIFSNDDQLVQRVQAAGRYTGERVWQLPLDPFYDKMIRSKIADMKNIGGANSGAITAAQFLLALHREGHGLGAPGYRRRRLAGRRAEAHHPQLGHRLGRAAAEPAGEGTLRSVTETLFYHLERRVAGRHTARPGGKIAAKGLAGGDQDRFRRTLRCAGHLAVDL